MTTLLPCSRRQISKGLARESLEAKALQLTGGPTSEKAPKGKNQYGWLMATGKADIFLT